MNDVYTLPFSAIDAGDLPRVGGKGANLGALARAGILVPPGFCVTTVAFDRFLAALGDAEARFAALDALSGQAAGEARDAAEAMRGALERLPIPEEVSAAILSALEVLGRSGAFAVRSSATAEDLPGASFAGQQDTYLNIRGEAALLDAVRRCWISLFTDRAVLYRARGGFDHRGVKLGVVVQRLVEAEVSGILFTADPVSAHRHVASIDAGFGLGEALVSGLINADSYKIDRRSEKILLAVPGDKAFAIRSLPGGGTDRVPLSEAQRRARSLDDEQVIALARLGTRVEALYGTPQDIEWCIERGEIFLVQARPITSLYPLPRLARADGGTRVFFSFGHLQMMLDAMPRFAREVWQLFFPVGKAHDPLEGAALSPALCDAGSRLYVDATGVLRLPPARRFVLEVLGHAYQALGASVAALVDREEFRSGKASARGVVVGALRVLGPVLTRIPKALLWADPRTGAKALTRAIIAFPLAARERIEAATTPADRVRQCAVELDATFFLLRARLPAMFSGMLAHRLLAFFARGEWCEGGRDDVELLLRGLPGNVTTEMDLAVGDLSDMLRPHPALARMLQEEPWPTAREAMRERAPGLLAALELFLERYGNRGASEIDVSRPRWKDDPALLLRVMSGGSSAEGGAHRKHHQAQAAEGAAAAARLVQRAKRGAWGWLRAWFVARLVLVARVGLGLREHPKRIIVELLGLVRAEALAAGGLLAARGQIAQTDDVWHLGFDELASALDDPRQAFTALVDARKGEFARDRTRKPPIVMSSEGEIPTLASRSDLPTDALAGTAASNGVVEGVAHVVLDPTREILRAGEILVAPFTDPGWTPLFLHAAGVVTEVGGLMTHGAVVAREYGIPAVVSVSFALERIKSGQRIRVDGTRGFVQILETP